MGDWWCKNTWFYNYKLLSDLFTTGKRLVQWLQSALSASSFLALQIRLTCISLIIKSSFFHFQSVPVWMINYMVTLHMYHCSQTLISICSQSAQKSRAPANCARDISSCPAVLPSGEPLFPISCQSGKTVHRCWSVSCPTIPPKGCHGESWQLIWSGIQQVPKHSR